MRRAFVAAIVVWAAGLGFAHAQNSTGESTPTPQPVSAQAADTSLLGMPEIMPAADTTAVAGPACSGPNCGAGCGGCAHTECGWVSGEYLLWYYRHAPLPPLATSGTPASAGILGQSGTTLLFGGDNEDNEPRSGARITLGYWLDDCQTSSVELSGFFLGWRAQGFAMAAVNAQVLSRPVIDATTGLEAVFPVGLPGVATGNLLISNRNLMYGVEANYLSCVDRHKAEQLSLCGCCLCCYQIDWLCGFRYLNFQETLDMQQTSTFGPFTQLPGETAFLADSFATRSQFWGPQAGFDAVMYQGPMAFELRGKLAVGASDETVNRLGVTGLSGPGGAQPVVPGGLYVSPGALGKSNRVDFAVVPELTFNIGYRFSDHCAGYVGYNLLYWSAVARAGDQVNRAVDLGQLPVLGGGANAPRVAPSVTTTDLWVQGLNVGIEFTW